MGKAFQLTEQICNPQGMAIWGDLIICTELEKSSEEEAPTLPTARRTISAVLVAGSKHAGPPGSQSQLLYVHSGVSLVLTGEFMQGRSKYSHLSPQHETETGGREEGDTDAEEHSWLGDK